MTYAASDFKAARFAIHEDGRVAMRSGRFPVDPWEDSTGIHHSDVGMIHAEYMPVPNLADALIAQQQLMQSGLDEALEEVSARGWAEGFNTGIDCGLGELGEGTPANPYEKDTTP